MMTHIIITRCNLWPTFFILRYKESKRVSEVFKEMPTVGGSTEIPRLSKSDKPHIYVDQKLFLVQMKYIALTISTSSIRTSTTCSSNVFCVISTLELRDRSDKL